MDFCLGGGSTDRIAVGRLHATFFFFPKIFFPSFHTVFSVFLITVRSSQLNSKVLVINSLEFRSHPLYHSTVFRIHFTINKGILNRRCILKGTVVPLFLGPEKPQYGIERHKQREGKRGEKKVVFSSLRRLEVK